MLTPTILSFFCGVLLGILVSALVYCLMPKEKPVVRPPSEEIDPIIVGRRMYEEATRTHTGK